MSPTFPVLFSGLSLAEQPFRPEEYLFLSKKIPLVAVFPCPNKNMNIPTGEERAFSMFLSSADFKFMLLKVLVSSAVT